MTTRPETAPPLEQRPPVTSPTLTDASGGAAGGASGNCMNMRSPYILPGWTKTQPRSRVLGPDDIQGYPTHAQRPRGARRLALVARDPTRPEIYACTGELQGLRRKGESVSSPATCSCDRGVVIPGAIAPGGWIFWFPTAVRFASPRVIRARVRDVSLRGFEGGI